MTEWSAPICVGQVTWAAYLAELEPTRYLATAERIFGLPEPESIRKPKSLLRKS
jgi:hypothetical protein